MIAFAVYGTPAPQGSKNVNKHGATYEVSKRVKPWREAVKHAALAICDGKAPLVGPLLLRADFYLARPKNHFGTGRNAGILKDSAPDYPAKVPDLSKVIRATEDALTDAGIWADDALVVEIRARKRWDDTRPPGAWISIGECP